MTTKGQQDGNKSVQLPTNGSEIDSFVLDKTIFSNVFERDIRRVYIYKKAERLAKAVQLVAPAFRDSTALLERAGRIAVALVDAATLSPTVSRDALSRELLALSSMLSIARSSGLLSRMNTEVIAREARLLLEEVATYEEPRLFLDEAPTLAALAKDLSRESATIHASPARNPIARASTTSHPLIPDAGQARPTAPVSDKGHDKGQQGPTQPAPRTNTKSDRREAILSVLRAKESVYIKDISTVVRDISEKTIQRELQTLVEEGMVTREGERRWTRYALS